MTYLLNTNTKVSFVIIILSTRIFIYSTKCLKVYHSEKQARQKCSDMQNFEGSSKLIFFIHFISFLFDQICVKLKNKISIKISFANLILLHQIRMFYISKYFTSEQPSIKSLQPNLYILWLWGLEMFG